MLEYGWYQHNNVPYDVMEVGLVDIIRSLRAIHQWTSDPRTRAEVGRLLSEIDPDAPWLPGQHDAVDNPPPWDS